MKPCLHIATAVAFLALVPAVGPAATDWVVDVMPGTIHANFEADNFSVTGPNGKETLSLISSLPNVNVGCAVEQEKGYLDLKLGAGMLLNSNVGSLMLSGSAAWHYEVRPSITVGPHAALTYFPSPEWWGDTELELDSTPGLLLGLHLSAGDRIAYLLCVDYVSVAFDIDMDKLPDDVTPSDDEIDMSGLSIQFGIRAQF